MTLSIFQPVRCIALFAFILTLARATVGRAGFAPISGHELAFGARADLVWRNVLEITLASAFHA